MFISRQEFFETNIADADQLHARPAILTSWGGQEPAAALFYGKQLKFVLPVADALRIANQLADSIEHHNHNHESQEATS